MEDVSTRHGEVCFHVLWDLDLDAWIPVPISKHTVQKWLVEVLIQAGEGAAYQFVAGSLWILLELGSREVQA